MYYDSDNGQVITEQDLKVEIRIPKKHTNQIGNFGVGNFKTMLKLVITKFIQAINNSRLQNGEGLNKSILYNAFVKRSKKQR